MSVRRPLVSIGLPVFNGEAYLDEAIRSVLAQSLADLELVISDNASTDRTAEICRDWAATDRRIRYFRNPENLARESRRGAQLQSDVRRKLRPLLQVAGPRRPPATGISRRHGRGARSRPERRPLQHDGRLHRRARGPDRTVSEPAGPRGGGAAVRAVRCSRAPLAQLCGLLRHDPSLGARRVFAARSLPRSRPGAPRPARSARPHGPARAGAGRDARAPGPVHPASAERLGKRGTRPRRPVGRSPPSSSIEPIAASSRPSR